MKFLKEIFKKIGIIRHENENKYRVSKIALSVVFPLFIVLITEYVQMNNIKNLFNFIISKPNILIFDIIIISVIYAAIILLTRRIFISAVFCSVLFFIFSLVEYFKYISSGLHLNIIDMTMSLNVGDITGFIDISLTKAIVIGALLLIAYNLTLFLLNIKFKLKRGLAYTGSLGLVLFFISIVAVEPIYTRVYSFFEVNTVDDCNMFISDDKFNDNELIAYLTESISKQVAGILNPPETYSMQAMQTMMVTSDDEPNGVETVKPNVIMIMSESFTDFRKFKQLDIPKDTYNGFDYVASNSFTSHTVVPTFGGGTVKTEFELMFGLPVKSLNNAPLPQNLLDSGTKQVTFAKFYDDLGYYTSYIHPFKSNFYNRDTVYPEYGFDKLMFMDDIDVEKNYFYDYIDDDTIFRQIEKILKDSEEPSYIYTTTMQNHKPFMNESFTGTELEYYLSGVKLTCDALAEFYNSIQKLNEPTIVLFVGDHYPFFSTDFNVYADIGITSENCDEIYDQKYIIFDNFGADYSKTTAELVSSFYLPHILTDISGVPKSNFITTTLNKISQVPVYTQTGDIIPSDDELNMLTYDRTLGERYSEKP